MILYDSEINKLQENLKIGVFEVKQWTKIRIVFEKPGSSYIISAYFWPL